MKSLDQKSRLLLISKNKLVERSPLSIDDKFNRMEYKKSYLQMAKDTDLLEIAEEGMGDYLEQLVDK